MVYSRTELYASGPQRSFPCDASEAAFLLGGIGTGTVSVGARGQFRDWELFNRPGKGNKLPYTFFAISTQEEGCPRVTKVLESKMQPPYGGSHGFQSDQFGGLPRLDSSTLRGEYPFVWVDFSDSQLPVQVKMEAFNPFIPLNADDSGIPGAIIRYTVKNLAPKAVDVTVVGSVANAVGFEGYGVFDYFEVKEECRNEFREDGSIQGIYYTSPELPKNHLTYGSMALTTTDRNVTAKTEWLDGRWWDRIHDFWDDLCADGRLERESKNLSTDSEFGPASLYKVGSLGSFELLQPGEERTFEFFLTWYFPNRNRDWQEGDLRVHCDDRELVRNYYATLFEDAWDVSKYLVSNLERLEAHSRDFHRALFSSTLPPYVIDALASNITVLRSNTCFRLEDGTFLGWEGNFDKNGCCHGSCTHVWNYAQTVAFLFPQLEMTTREMEFNLETDEQGAMAFRGQQIFGKKRWEMLPATDGQLGAIVRVYREWKLTGDDEFLKRVWTNVKKALDFAFTFWDSDGDNVLDSRQHNTYDIEFYGPNSMTNSIFFAALRAGEQMASHLGENDVAEKYRTAWEQGNKKMDELLWGGEYYVQQIDDVDKYRYQYGIGCLSDQLLGQTFAHIVGLGHILPEEHVKQAVYSVFKYNFRDSLADHHNVQRTYALNDEKGLLLCSWPLGGRPKLPFVYCDEVWTGIEYQVATHLIYEGFVEEGLTIVRAVRDRQDGYRRSPWNEVECGHHYARSLASWGILPALTGFKFDMVAKTISFDPALNKNDFSSFFSTGTAWGIYRQKLNNQTGTLDTEIEVLYGSLDGVQLI